MPQLIRGGLVGLLIGAVIGMLAGLTFLWWDGRTAMALARLGADPALASGPVATVYRTF